MSEATVTRVALGECAVEVECRVEELEAPLAAMLLDTRREGGELQTRFVVDQGSEHRYEIRRGDDTCFRGDSAGDLCTFLVGEIIFHLIENNRSELLVHAACLDCQGMGILLPGVSGSGKSTLSAWLASRGFGYHTDELVCIDPRDHGIESFTRPLNIKRGGMSAVRSTFGEGFGEGEVIEGGFSSLVPHRLFGPAGARRRATARVIVFPRFSASADFSLRPLSTAKTALLLMQTFVNARNHDDHGFPLITAFARTVHGYELHYAHFDQLPALEELLRDHAAAEAAGDAT